MKYIRINEDGGVYNFETGDMVKRVEIVTTGCGCCEGSEELTPEVAKAAIKECEEFIEQLRKYENQNKNT